MKDELAKDIFSMMREFLETDDSSYDNNYVGVVEDNNDPSKYGRCKIRVHGLYDDMATEDMPWAIPKNALPIGPAGSFIVPELGTVVEVIFDDGDIYEPTYTNKLLDVKNNNFKADKDEDYPNSLIFYETSNGDYLKVNRAKGEFILKTGAGVFLKMCQDGSIFIDNRTSNDGNADVYLKGNFTIDNRLGNLNLITNNCSLSAFGDIDITSNGGITAQCLDDITFRTNSNYEVTTGERMGIKAKTQFKTETKEMITNANSVSFNPAMPMGTPITDKTDVITPIAEPFTFGIGDDVTKVAAIMVTPEVLGGPFNCLPFDPLTGAVHQGRLATGTMLPVFAKDSADRASEIATQIASYTTRVGKLEAIEISDIKKKYASIDTAVQMILNGPTGAAMAASDMATEIATCTQKYADMLSSGIDDIKNNYGTYLTSPIFGTTTTSYEGDRTKYKNTTLPAAETQADLDITGMTRAIDIAGIGDGLIEDVVNE